MAPPNKKESNNEPGFKLMARSSSDFVLRQRQHPQTREHSTWVLDTDTDHYVAGPFRSHAQAQHALIRARQEIMAMPDIPGVVEDQLALGGLISQPSRSDLTLEEFWRRSRLRETPNPCGAINLADIRPSGPRLSVADRETLRYSMPGGEHLQYVGEDFGNIERQILGRMQEDEAVANFAMQEITEGVAEGELEVRFGIDHGLEESYQGIMSDVRLTTTGRTVSSRNGGNRVILQRGKVPTPVWSVKGTISHEGKPSEWFVLRAAKKFAGPFPSAIVANDAKEYLTKIAESDFPYTAALTGIRAMRVDNDEELDLKARIRDLENTLVGIMDVASAHGKIIGKRKYKKLRVNFDPHLLEMSMEILKGKKADEVHKKTRGDSSGRYADRRRRNVRVSDASRSASSQV